MMPRLRTDRGAIRFVLSGADIMCPGLTSAGASMEDVGENAPVVRARRARANPRRRPRPAPCRAGDHGGGQGARDGGGADHNVDGCNVRGGGGERPRLRAHASLLLAGRSREKNKGIGVRNIHYLNDGLWQHPTL